MRAEGAQEGLLGQIIGVPGRRVMRYEYRWISAWWTATTVSNASSAITLLMRHRGSSDVKDGDRIQQQDHEPLMIADRLRLYSLIHS